jgi:hypothetical protein
VFGRGEEGSKGWGVWKDFHNGWNTHTKKKRPPLVEYGRWRMGRRKDKQNATLLIG